MKPQRHPSQRNYVSYEQYPHDNLPPYADGNIYILSADLVRYIASDCDHLVYAGDLEDVSIGWWLQNKQVSEWIIIYVM